MYGDGEMEVSEGWRQIRDLSTTTDPNISSIVHEEDHFCKLILYKEIRDSRVRIWDVIILIPNVLFLLFIGVRFNRARLKLRATSSPIYMAFYGLVVCSVVISVVRCIVSMTVDATENVGGIVDKVLWVTVRFFLLSTEMSVVIFGLAFGHLDSRSSIRRVLLATSFIALLFTITQGTLELVLPDDTFHIPSRDFYVFGHGGMMFWFCSSIVFTMIYLFILVVPYTRLRERLTLPNRKGFYVYASLLATLDLVQSIGAGLLNYIQNQAGLCVVDLTAAMYLTLFTPVVYHTFLSDFLGVSQPSIMFSYKAQVDDAMDEDTVSLPHQQSFSSLKTDSDYIYQVHTPCFHAPLFHNPFFNSGYLATTSTSTTATSKPGPSRFYASSRLAGMSSSHASLLYQDYYAAQRRTFYPKSRLGGVRTSAPDLRSIASTSGTTPKRLQQDSRTVEATASSSNLLLSPSTASKFAFKPRKNDSKTNLFSSDENDELLEVEEKRQVTSTFNSPRIEKSRRGILGSDEIRQTKQEETEEKRSASAAAGLNDYLRHMRNYSDDENNSNIEVEVKMLPHKSRETTSDAGSSSQSEAL
ncbi:transmembrane protein adipocyte-associated 1 homolog [Nasonia vitripennis]|uniref:Transmembrane protein adipocyte-associated 1 homolog n=1 Tax=Nasonia vitripennis TaxID=7425 RepID=A0A7M7QBP7_NASVI|nr:transmembrane protein adipocyte-associated 1 homolog [Nasonia vitripennis]XP_031785096.1 transmembrane protein adipocyte-associated 1 homolog [Nasonia vitripennis]XP_031785097.1 transmembrane protein adipocyte-associated 1 homolog [Nasonia vitripennis]XP_031785098.1 transmembrane protein adipocyte-associated 1 homolog [Nasonia vitripennis]XP_031785099.1 transmembrane protein adipocyte-associated 1 homolog [Nasonia vitripennis]XP_031785100.1 transmembrane protein adipocyte-associated 1 homol